jgi:hypothetical protein
VFQNLTSDNLHSLWSLAKPEDLQRLKVVAANAPTTDQGWKEIFVLESWCGPWNEEAADRKRHYEKEAIARYRRGG